MLDVKGGVQRVVVEKRFLSGADYNQTFGDLVEYGKYDGGVNPDVLIPGRFKGCRHRQPSNEISIVSFDHAVDFDEIIETFDNMCMRPTEPPELLMLGAHHDTEQLKSVILALGAIWHKPGDGRFVIGLGHEDAGTKRTVNVYRCNGVKWPAGYYRFAAVSLV